MLTSTALTSLRHHLIKSIAYARYKVGDNYHRAGIETAEVQADGRVAVTFVIDHSVSGDITVTQVQLCDYKGNVWAQKAENITRKNVQEGVLYRFRFMIDEA